MTHTLDETHASDAFSLMNSFYWIGQTLIGEQDGGIADHFEQAQDIEGDLAPRILSAISRKVGEDAVSKRSAELFDTDLVMGGVEPLVPVMDDMDEGTVDSATELLPELFFRNIYRVFPEMEDTGLERFGNEVRLIAGNYVRSEWSFTDSYPGGHAL